MTELNRQRHEELGGAFSADPYFGGWIESLGGLYNPGMGEQNAGRCYASMVNMLDSIARLAGNVSQLVIYHDDSDDATEFSVREGTVAYNGHWIAYPGETNLGPLTRGANNHIWMDLAGAPSVSIARGASWPTTPHLRLAEILMPTTGHWLPSQIIRRLGAQAVQPIGGASATSRATLTHTSGATTHIGVVPAGQATDRVIVWVETAFDGEPTLTIGDAGDPARLVAAGDIDLTQAQRYEYPICCRYAAATSIQAAFTPGGSTTGKLTIKVETL